MDEATHDMTITTGRFSLPVGSVDKEVGEQGAIADALQDGVHVARIAQVFQTGQSSALHGNGEA